MECYLSVPEQVFRLRLRMETRVGLGRVGKESSRVDTFG
jgi:hypothetical protein